MTVHELLASRRVCRDFLPDPIRPATRDRVLDAARRAPTAGNTWALDLVVLEGPAETRRYWDAALPGGAGGFRWPGLLAAPLLVVAVVDCEAYVRRYAEADKASSGLGGSTSDWPVPYWWVDAGAAVMALLLAAEEEALGALLFGQFGREPAVKAALGIPAERRCAGTIALGYKAPGRSSRSRSAGRGRPSLGEVVHRGGW